jgi:hypothetical protein
MPIHMSFEDLPAPYDRAEPDSSVTVAQAPAVPTVVVRADDFPAYRIPTMCRQVLTRLGRALDDAGIQAAGPAFVLHRRHPIDTADVEIGLPVRSAPSDPLTLPADDAALPADDVHDPNQAGPHDEDVSGATDARELIAVTSELPAGRVGVASYVGPRDALADAWGEFTQDCGDLGEQMTYPYWEMFGPVSGDRTRTDLVSLLEPRDD